jgi:hypothetical protein
MRETGEPVRSAIAATDDAWRADDPRFDWPAHALLVARAATVVRKVAPLEGTAGFAGDPATHLARRAAVTARAANCTPTAPVRLTPLPRASCSACEAASTRVPGPTHAAVPGHAATATARAASRPGSTSPGAPRRGIPGHPGHTADSRSASASAAAPATPARVAPRGTSRRDRAARPRRAPSAPVPAGTRRAGGAARSCLSTAATGVIRGIAAIRTAARQNHRDEPERQRRSHARQHRQTTCLPMVRRLSA